MYDVVFYEAFKEEETAIKKYLPHDIQAKFTPQTIQDSKDKAPLAGLISIRTQSRVPVSWVNKMKGLLSRSQGYDHVETVFKKSKTKIPCGYLKDYCARAVAEHAVMAMMVLLRKLKQQMKSFDTFQRDHLTGFECLNRRALVVGVGEIGSEIVDIALGLKMLVKGVDIAPHFKGVTYVSIQQGIAWADVVFCALPLTELTKGLLNYQLLNKAKPGMVLINISRGEISPDGDLKILLDKGLLGAVSLDVYSQESLLADYLRGKRKMTSKTIRRVLELKNHENVLFTPHNAFNTYEAVDRKASLSVDAVVSFLVKGIFPNQVSRETNPRKCVQRKEEEAC
ncbi:MAG: hypothetical protein A2Y04_04830 [Omnitrophica WOR_2 bacterium GWC2_45_7]|nr:MAG: hypothetical protein A2Z81_06020 [Omnitrophica WOR_2 bacterium GWA2_45_18]OGX18814.1 MAG: hypothetical protein A2Y04_04830 [Omnitrophica WOR_2 bacterium GWC2_45_7]